MSEVVGQELAIHQMTDAICDHLGKEQSNRPLVLSVHGPPGTAHSLLNVVCLMPALPTSRSVANGGCSFDEACTI